LLTITQLCRQTGATPRALRYYEQIGLLTPGRRDGQSRVYSRREQVRLRLIIQGRRVGLRLNQIRRLFEIFEQQGPHAQFAHALPLLKAQLAVLERRRGETDDTLALLNAASARMAASLPATAADRPD
jgi:DNA-binding transcriptional MerR regulator